MPETDTTDPQRVYAVLGTGTWLGGLLPDGSEVVIDPDAEIRPLDVCAIVFRDDAQHWSRSARRLVERPLNGMLKLFVGRYRASGRDVLIVAELNPPHLSLIPLDEIESLHRVLYTIPSIEVVGDLELAAMDLLQPFIRRAPIQPINSAWRPPVLQEAA